MQSPPNKSASSLLSTAHTGVKSFFFRSLLFTGLLKDSSEANHHNGKLSRTSESPPPFLQPLL